jgi:hypothetical protein
MAFRWADPTTWPWFIWIWIAVALLNLLRPLWVRYRLRIATSWPLVTGRIESTESGALEHRWFQSRRYSYVATLIYTYSVAGQVERNSTGATSSQRIKPRNIPGDCRAVWFRSTTTPISPCNRH